jgi:hypothetical protein
MRRACEDPHLHSTTCACQLRCTVLESAQCVVAVTCVQGIQLAAVMVCGLDCPLNQRHKALLRGVPHITLQHLLCLSAHGGPGELCDQL